MRLSTIVKSVITLSSLSIAIAYGTLSYMSGIDAVSMNRDGVNYVKASNGLWIETTNPNAPSLTDDNPEGYGWDLFTIPFSLPGTSGQCGEDSGIKCE